MSMSMEPSNSSGLYEEMDSGGEGGSTECVDNDRAAATLIVSHSTSGGGNIPDSMRGSIPAPFRSSSTANYRQYNLASKSVPSMLPSSVSVPSSMSLATSGSQSPLNGEQPSRTFSSSQSKIETIKNWSISTYKCTKQLMFEKLGKTSRTVDSELETRIDHLRDIKRRYLQVLGLSRAFTSHFYHAIQTQQALADVFSDLAQKSPELQQEFLFNAETQRNLHKNGEVLLSALNFFLSSVNTLCNKTIEDTILTIRQYENSRIEYDAYRSDLELMLQVPKNETSSAKVEEAQRNFNIYKTSYEKLRDDVNIKLQFLDENRIKVMHKQLLLFHNAISAYFSGNQQALESTIKQFSVKIGELS